MLDAYSFGSSLLSSIPSSFTGTIVNKKPRLGIMSKYANPSTKPPLEPRFYNPTEEEVRFLQSQTGIQDRDQLKQHILEVQQKAYDIYGYPCIRFMSFIRMGIKRLPIYQSVLSLARDRKDAIILDIGCCFGNDLRKVCADGWPVQNAVASDLRQGYWDFGHELFKSTPETFPATFVGGDAFSNRMIAPRTISRDPPTTPRPELKSLKSLTPLQGHVSAIHAHSFFHLFDEKKQQELALRLATLISPLPGSIIFGSHIGLPKMGKQIDEIDSTMFCHSPESWRALWEGIFGKGKVRVDAALRQIDHPDMQGVLKYLLIWSVTIL